MKDCNLLNIHTPEDPLQAVLKQGAQQLLQQAIDIEVQALLARVTVLQLLLLFSTPA